MRLERCRGKNLLNHCIQKGIPKDLEVEYLQVKNYTGPKLDSPFFPLHYNWVCTVSFGPNIYRACNTSKRKALDEILNKCDFNLRSYLNPIKI